MDLETLMGFGIMLKIYWDFGIGCPKSYWDAELMYWDPVWGILFNRDVKMRCPPPQYIAIQSV